MTDKHSKALKILTAQLQNFISTASPQGKEILAICLEQQARRLRRSILTKREEEIMNWLRLCRDARIKPLGFYFHAQTVTNQGVNLVQLEAMHWVKPLPYPLPRELFWEPILRPRRYNGEILVLDPRGFSQYQNDNLHSKWRDGRPWELSDTGYLSLALGYPFYGLSIGDWQNGLDGQEAAIHREKQLQAEQEKAKKV